MDDDVSQIGRVSDAVGLSLRTIRYYEEIGLISPSGRTSGGFRLYGQEDIDRLLLIKRMKPLGYSLDEVAKLLALLDAVDGVASETTSRQVALTGLQAYADTVQQRLVELQAQVDYAHEFHERLTAEINRRAGRDENGPDLHAASP